MDNRRHDLLQLGVLVPEPVAAGAMPVTGPVLVGVIGPPGAGKSTVVGALAAEDGFPVFRLREAVRARPDLLDGPTPSIDPLGWVGVEAVRRLLQATFVDDRFGFASSAVLLDNFPGTAEQLTLLARIAAAGTARVALLELRADVGTVAGRVARRRVCSACSPDPHAPAVAADNDPERCGSCRAVLARRDTDGPGSHALRLARYGANWPKIVQCAVEHRIPHLAVNADATMPEVCQAACVAIRRLTESAVFQGADRDHHRAAHANPAPRPNGDH